MYGTEKDTTKPCHPEKKDRAQECVRHMEEKMVGKRLLYRRKGREGGKCWALPPLISTAMIGCEPTF